MHDATPDVCPKSSSTTTPAEGATTAASDHASTPSKHWYVEPAEDADSDDGLTSRNTSTERKYIPARDVHRCSIPTDPLFCNLSLNQELTQVMKNMAMDIISSHVHVKIDELLPFAGSEIDTKIRCNGTYLETRKTMSKLVTHLLFKNKRILYEYVSEWLSNEILGDSDSKSAAKPTTDHHLNLNTITLMPKLRAFFRLVIDRSFAGNISHSYDVKNWLMISTCHMIGVLICECYQNKTDSSSINSKEYLKKLTRIVARSISDYITTNHMQFMEAVGGWAELSRYDVNDRSRSSSRILVLRDSVSGTTVDEESLADQSVSSLASRQEERGVLTISTTVLPIIFAATLGVIGYKKLSKS